jgi:glutamine amidotransferase
MAKKTVAVIDYGSGNLQSAANALRHAAAESAPDTDIRITNAPEIIAAADRILLPGQGAFGDCMAGLKAIDGLVEALEQAVLKRGTPYLGICVGMQLMASRGLEHGTHEGLGWIPGEVIPLAPNDPSLKIPHMGWNTLLPVPDIAESVPHFVLRNIESSEHYYFVHSFMFQCENSHHSLGLCDYGGHFTAVVGRDNMIGVQFHPEKSQQAGLRLLSDFLRWRP